MNTQESTDSAASVHPSIKRFLAKRAGEQLAQKEKTLDAGWLRQVCLDAGASDVGFVSVDSELLSAQQNKIKTAFPRTQALISIVCRMNADNVRSLARSVANLEFHKTTEEVNDVARKIVTVLRDRGIHALNPSAGFPMEMDRFPDKEIWVIGHKPVAVAAGMGKMGIHRNVIHPKFGNFIILGTILLDAKIAKYNQALDYNPCLSCTLCVAACPVGAIHPDGYFNFSACYTHNYREFMGGFADWVGQIAESSSASNYKSKVTTSETASMWQSLSFGANYKAAYCLAVCPAGDDIIGQYLSNKAEFIEEIVRPLQKKEETIYVVANSDAEEFVTRRFPHKKVKRIGNGLSLSTIDGFLRGLRIVFQPGKAKGVSTRYHFYFTGAETRKATVVIDKGRVKITEIIEGEADLKIIADSQTWLKFLANKQTLPMALITRKIRLAGPPKLLIQFGKCFV